MSNEGPQKTEFHLFGMMLKTGRTTVASLIILACANQTPFRKPATQPGGGNEIWSMGFWTGVTRQPLSDLEWDGLTHIMHVAVAPRPDGSLTYTCAAGPCSLSQLSAEAATLVNTAHSHNVKVLLSTVNVSGDLYRAAVTNNFMGFVNNMLNLVDAAGYDGIDVDWEQNLDKTILPTLLATLRQAMGTKLLTADADGSDPKFWASVESHLDRVNALTYDWTGNNFSWFNSPLFGDACNCVWSYDLMRQRMTAAGVPAAKLNMGIPFYGWVLTGGGILGPRVPGSSTSMKQINYSAIVAQYDISGASWDSAAHVPWMVIPNGWLSFENTRSITDKVNYVQDNHLGGWIIYEIEQDYLPSNDPKHPLLNALAEAMAGGGGQ